METDALLELQRELETIFAALARRLQWSGCTVRMDAATDRAYVTETTIVVPEHYEAHWRRFHTIPTDLGRDVALAACRATRPPMDEADAVAFAEAFVREHLLGRT